MLCHRARCANGLQKRKVAIVYGSQTGTAHEYAIAIAKEVKARLGLRSLVFDAEDVDYDSLDQLKDSLVVFVLATYGDGEPTDNAKSLWSFLSQVHSLPTLHLLG